MSDEAQMVEKTSQFEGDGLTSSVNRKVGVDPTSDLQEKLRIQHELEMNALKAQTPMVPTGQLELEERVDRLEDILRQHFGVAAVPHKVVLDKDPRSPQCLPCPTT